MSGEWPRRSIASLGDYVNGFPFKPDDHGVEGLPVIRIKQLNDVHAEVDYFDGPVPRRNHLSSGDLVFSWSGSLSVKEWDRGPALLNQHLFKVIPRPGIDKAWLRWALVTAIDDFEAHMHGSAMTHITKPMMRAVRVPLPPLEVQRRIADFLDNQVARIDRAIQLRQRQIELLQEWEESEHFRLVSGRDVEGKRLERGLPWLGSLPAHWGVATVGSQFEAVLGKMLNEERGAGENQMPYLRNTNVQWNRVDLDDLKTMSFSQDEVARYGVREGDLLVCEGGQPGRAAIYDGGVEPLFFQKALHRVRPRRDSVTGWLLCCLRVAVKMDVFAVGAGQTTIGHLTSEQFRAQRFPFPTRDEQRTRCSRLQRVSLEVDGARSVLQRANDLLGERNRSLITAAVTGEFDVSSASSRAADVVITRVGV